jgi:hypothetical protein
MSRQVYLLGVGMVLVAGALLAADAALGPRPGVTAANVRRIREGMTLEQVEGILGSGLQVAAPPLVEPDLGAADGGADGLDGPASEAQGDSAMARVEFVVHGYLRVAAAGGCPRR